MLGCSTWKKTSGILGLPASVICFTYLDIVTALKSSARVIAAQQNEGVIVISVDINVLNGSK